MVGVTGGTSTPIEDLRDVAERIITIAGTPDTRPDAAGLARRGPRPGRDPGRPHDLAAGRSTRAAGAA